MSQALAELKELCSPIWNLYSVRSLLYWDQQVQMPLQGGSARGEQLAALETVCHERLVSDRFAAALDKAEAENPPADIDRRYLRAARRSYDLAAKLPASLVAERARVQARAVEVWAESKRNDDFTSFLPHLREVFRLAREVADHRGYQHHPYDALVDEYEPGMTTPMIENLFEGLLPGLVQLVQALATAEPPSRKILQQRFPLEGQKQFSQHLLRQIGFNLERGRLDQSTHPFCAATSSVDVRLTDRLDENALTMSIFGGLHEGGHGLYEQGSPVEWNGTPLAGGCSLGIHESQSRLWENLVGRSLPFWKAQFPVLRSIFPEQLSGYSVDDFYRAINYVEPSYIRVEADEVTYTLHIVMRFQLERDMLSGQLDPSDLPEAWNAKMKNSLGITPPTQRLGCLQDIHWSDGLIGYFPTYSLGNLVASQLWNQILRDIPQLDEQLQASNCCALLGWLRDKVHRQASSVTPTELMERVCGSPLDHQPFLRYLQSKFGRLYGISSL